MLGLKLTKKDLTYGSLNTFTVFSGFISLSFWSSS